MKDLSTVARWTTPAAMVAFLTYEMSNSLAAEGGWRLVFLIASALSALGIEFVGLLAGATLEGYWRINDLWRSLFSFALLVAYTIIGIYVLRNNAILVALPAVSAIVYIISALSDGLADAAGKKAKAAAVNQQYLLDKRKADDEVERQLRLNQQNLRHAEKMAKLQLVSAEDSPKLHETDREGAPLSGKAQEVFDYLSQKPSASNTEIGQVLGISRQYAGQVRRDLNGRLTQRRIG